MKHYMDIVRIKEKYANAFTLGENVIIQVKVDGSNASFTYDPTTNSILAFSRKLNFLLIITCAGSMNLQHLFQ